MKKQCGALTIEGSFIFTWIIFLTVAFLRLDFSLHDRAMVLCCETLGELRIEQMANYSYDGTTEQISLEEVMSTPLVGTKTATKAYAERVRTNAVTYYNTRRIGNQATSMSVLSENMELPKKNAEILRAGTKIIQLMGKETD